MPILLIFCAVVLWIMAGGFALTGQTDLHFGVAFVLFGLGVLATGLAGACQGLADLTKATRKARD